MKPEFTAQGARFGGRNDEYRYTLHREWDGGHKTVLFIMLNPSTADTFTLDPTVRRCVGFAQRWGYHRLEVVNLFAVRATDPKVMRAHREPIGYDNDMWIANRAQKADRIVAAWGILDVRERRRSEHVLSLLDGKGVDCLGRTVGHFPRHPLYVRGDTVPEFYFQSLI